jgi:hypothetical protein
LPNKDKEYKNYQKELKEAKDKIKLAQQAAAATKTEIEKKKELIKLQEKEVKDARVILSIHKENLKSVDELKQKQLSLAVINKDLSDEDKKRLETLKKVIALDAADVSSAKEKLKLLEELNKEQQNLQKEYEKDKENRDDAIDSYKEIIKQKQELLDLEKESNQNISDYNSELTSVGNILGKNNKIYKTIQSRQDAIQTTVKSVSAIIQTLPDSQNELSSAATKALSVYKDSEASMARALKDLGLKKISQEEYNSVAQKTNESLQDALSYIDQSTDKGQALYNTLKNAGVAGTEFATSMQKSEKSFSALSAGFDNFGGIPAMSELNSLIKTNIKDTLAFKAAVFALGAALGKAALDYFGAPIKAAMQADRERKQNEIDTARNIAKIRKDGEFIGAQIALERREAEIQGTLAVARAMHEAGAAQTRAAHEFKQSMKQGAAQFERASKTALFGESIGSISYGAAQMQLAGIGADKVANAMMAAGSAMGKMPSSEIASQMAVMSERTGASTEDIAEISSLFQRVDGMSAQMALNMQEGMRAMANKAGINLSKFMSEVAEASKDALGYQIKSGPALAKQVAYAQSLGVSFGDIAKAGKSMVLNYKDSIKAEMQLSTLLGEQVDLSEVREKFASGDTKGAMEALKAQGLDPAQMDMFQQEALSQALGGLDLQSISKIATGKGADVGDLKAGDAKKGGQDFLSRTQAAEATLNAKQAQISAESAVFDAKLSAAMEQAFIGSAAYKESKEAQNKLAQDTEALSGAMNDAWLATDEYKKSLSDSMKLDFVSGIKEALLTGFAMLAGGVLTSMIGGIAGPMVGMLGKVITSPFKLVGKLATAPLKLVKKGISGVKGIFSKKGDEAPGTTGTKKGGIFSKVTSLFSKKKDEIGGGALFSKSNPGYVIAIGGMGGEQEGPKLFIDDSVSQKMKGVPGPVAQKKKDGAFSKIASVFKKKPKEDADIAQKQSKGFFGKLSGGFTSIFKKQEKGQETLLERVKQMKAQSPGMTSKDALAKIKGEAEPTEKKGGMFGKFSGIFKKKGGAEAPGGESIAEESKGSFKDKIKEKIGGVKDKIKGKLKGLVPKPLAGLFGGGDEEGAEGVGGATEELSSVAGTQTDKAGEALNGVAEAAPKGIEGILTGIANGLKAFANPMILVGAGVLAGSIVILGAGIAGAVWIISKALPSLAEGLSAFNTIDGKNLGFVGLGLIGLGAGMAAMGVGAVVSGIGNLVGGLFGGGMEDTIKKMEEFSKAKINVQAVKTNSEAVVAYSTAMAALGAGKAIGGIGNLVGAVADGIAGFFGKKPPIDEMQNFAKYDFGKDADKIKQNAEVFAIFGNAMSSFQGTSGGLTGVLGDALAGFFKLDPPIEQMKKFALEDFGKDKERIKNNAEAFSAFGNAMATFKGMNGGLMTVLADGVGKFLGVETTPFDKFKEFAAIEGIDVAKTKNNAEAFTAFGNAMASYTGTDEGFFSKLGDGIRAFFGGGEKDIIGDFERFAKVDASGVGAVADSIGKMSTSLSGFSSEKAIQVGSSLEQFTDYLNDGELDTMNLMTTPFINASTGIKALAPAIQMVSAASITALGVALHSFATNISTSFVGVSELINGVSTELNNGFISGMSELSVMSEGILATADAFYSLADALGNMANVDMEAINSLPWIRMTAFAAAGGSISIPQQANKSFNVTQDTAKNIDVITKSPLIKKAEQNFKNETELVRINKNLQNILMAILTNNENSGNITLQIDGKQVTKVIKKQEANLQGQGDNTGKP